MTLVSPDAQRKATRGAVRLGVNKDDLRQAIDDWHQAPTVGRLGEILSFAVSEECVEAVSVVARDVLENNHAITPSQRTVLLELLDVQHARSDVQGSGGICNPYVQEQARETRRILRINPSNPLTLLDYAQLQLAAGKSDHAEKLLKGALALSPNSRIVIRTLARFLVHTGSVDEAHRLLSRHELTPNDPWLIASEIAIAQVAGRTPRFMKKGWKLARDSVGSGIEVSELAGAIGGIELAQGNFKSARDLFRVALLRPNDNVIAQAITDQRMLGLSLDAPAQRDALVNASEAKTLVAWGSMDDASAESSALQWHAEEPYSSRPIQFLTSLYAASGRHNESVLLCYRGLLSDPNDGNVLANLIYGLACTGELVHAERIAKRLLRDQPHLSGQVGATLGLINFLRGEFAAGDAKYREAIAIFERNGESQTRSLCYSYYLRAAIDTQHPNMEVIAKEAVESFRKAPSVDAAYIFAKMREELERIDDVGDIDLTSATPDEGLRQLGQWIYDEEHNILIRKEGITVRGASAFVVKRKG